MTTPLFKKLNLKDQPRIHVLGAPESFTPELDALHGIEIKRDAKGKIDFAIAFAVTQKQLDDVSGKLAKAAQGDALLWIAYPKGTSKRYTCEFKRDSGWTVLGDAGYEPVRMVAIDEDWSALRFRKAEHIKTMTRNALAPLSAAGKAKAATNPIAVAKAAASTARKTPAAKQTTGSKR